MLKTFVITIMPIFILSICLFVTGCDDTNKMMTVVNNSSTETQEPETIKTEIILAIEDQSDKALTPMNAPSEFGQFFGIWEKFVGKDTPPRPLDFVTFNTKLFDHFFYSHADSKIIWDISEHPDIVYFKSGLLLPNPCPTSGSVIVSFLVDDTEIYNSGIIRGGDVREIEFEIPQETQTLTLIVLHANDGHGCDHFILGNAKIYNYIPNAQ